MSDQLTKVEASDAELIERARSGDSDAFGELWTRHYRSAARVARQFTSSIDADDLVSEAYARIYQRILAGGGPTGGFRPYLYTTIRNLASTWGAQESRNVNVEDAELIEDERIPDDPGAWALDRTLTARAFRTLPERWQTVLWYTEVEGMDPHEVAPMLGLTANGVAALSYRAREGLRTAWLQAHISDATASGECRWTIARLGSHVRHSLTEREQGRLEAHLASCTKCTIISEEVEEVGSHLALVLIPLTLGGIVGGALLSQMSAGGASAATIPAMPASVVSAAGSTGAAAGGATLATAGAAAGTAAVGSVSAVGVPALIGGLAVVAALGSAVILGPSAPAQSVPRPATVSHSTTVPAPAASTATAPDSADPAATTASTGSAAGAAASGVAGTATTVGGAATTTTTTVGSTVSSATSTAGGVVSGVGSAVGGAVGGTVGGVVSGTGSTVGGTVSGVGSTVGGTVSGTGSAVGGAVSGTGSTVGGLLGGSGSALTGSGSGSGSTTGSGLGGSGLGGSGGLLGGSGSGGNG